MAEVARLPRKERKEVYLAAEAGCGHPRGVNNSNPTDVAYLDSILWFVGKVLVLPGASNPKSRLSTGVYRIQQIENSSAHYKCEGRLLDRVVLMFSKLVCLSGICI